MNNKLIKKKWWTEFYMFEQQIKGLFSKISIKLSMLNMMMNI